MIHEQGMREVGHPRAASSKMCRCAFFVSAPTVRFLRAVKQLRLLSATQKRNIALTVYSEIKPLVGSSEVDALRRAAQAAQDERWRLVFAGTRDMRDPRFASVVLAEQWILAQAELARTAPPVAEVLASKRRDVVEGFIRDHLSFNSGEIIHLHAYASLRLHHSLSKAAA
jgi:hypothetical protein